MWRNYLAAALRNLARNKFYSAISLASLTLGLATAMLVFLYVRNELGYDRWLPGHEHIYQISSTLVLPGRAPQRLDDQQSEVGEWLRDSLGQTQVARVWLANAGFRPSETEQINLPIAWADPEIFQVLPFPAFAGDLKTALQAPDTVVLTRKQAQRIFGRDDVVGKTVGLNRRTTVTVTAVLEDFPPTRMFHREIFVRRAGSSTGGWNTNFLRPAPGVSIQTIESQLATFGHRNTSKSVKLILQPIPIAEVQLSRDGRRATLYSFAAAALLVLLIAGINFINLMTARAARRAAEVGIRKASGAHRRDFVWQFMSEGAVYVLVSVLLAIALIELLLPALNAYLDASIEFDYLQGGSFWILIATVLGTAFLVGFYPAIVLSAFRPADVLRGGTLAGSGSRSLRGGLVVFQFAILILLAFSTMVVFRQISHGMAATLRSVGGDPILLIEYGCVQSLKERISALPGVIATTCAESAPLNKTQRVQNRETPRGEIGINLMPVTAGFFEFYGFRPLAGRFFPPDRPEDSAADSEASTGTMQVVINETARKRLGYPSAAAALGQRPFAMREGDKRPAEIVGVVADFAVSSVREEIRSSVFYADPKLSRLMSVKLRGRDLPETLRAIDVLWNPGRGSTGAPRFFLDEAVQQMYLSEQREGRIFSIFAAIACAISCLGLLGLAAFTTQQRAREIGIRKALGAKSLDVVRLLLWQFSKPVLFAIVIAWPTGYLLMSRWLNGFAYRIELAPWMFLAPSAAALAIALLTVSVHAFTVARAKPVEALRHD